MSDARKANRLVTRLAVFSDQWLSNPAAALEFANLVAAVHQQPTHDHADEELLTWIDEERATARRLGVK